MVTVPSPNANGDNFLSGVSCTSAGFCAAVGKYGPVASHTLAEIGTSGG